MRKVHNEIEGNLKIG